MKKIFILFLYIVLNIGLSAQNNVLNFNQRGISVKEDISTPVRNVSTNQNYIDLEYDFEEAISSELEIITQ